MINLFIKENIKVEEAIFSINEWKNIVFSILEKEVKIYFSEKVIVYFDNYMLFHKERGFHNNLMEALALSSQDMYKSNGVFNRVEIKWSYEESSHFLMIYGLKDRLHYTLENIGFKLLEKNVSLIKNQEERLEKEFWSTLVFDIELVNFSNGWINFIPEIERRCNLQTEFILLNNQFKKKDLTLLEKIDFENKLTQHPMYDKLYEKILRVMPKIEESLEYEYKQQSKLIEKTTEEVVTNTRKYKV